MVRKKNRHVELEAHLRNSAEDVFVLPARRHDKRRGHYELLKGAPIIGLTAGDMVSCRTTRDGSRHLCGLESLRQGTLGALSADRPFEDRQMTEMLTRAAEEWIDAGCREIDVFDNGVMAGFWPAAVPRAAVAAAVRRSGKELRLTSSTADVRTRMTIVRNLLDFEGPAGRVASVAA